MRMMITMMTILTTMMITVMMTRSVPGLPAAAGQLPPAAAPEPSKRWNLRLVTIIKMIEIIAIVKLLLIMVMMKLEDSETTSPLTTCDRYPCLLEL